MIHYVSQSVMSRMQIHYCVNHLDQPDHGGPQSAPLAPLVLSGVTVRNKNIRPISPDLLR